MAHPRHEFNETALAEMLDLYVKRAATTAQLGERFGVSYKTIARRLRELGVLPRGRLPRRQCAREGCTEETLRARSKFCGNDCYQAARRLPPRPCERKRCGRSFVPPPHKVARGAGGRFCSYSCWNQWRTGRPQREWRARVEQG